VKERPMFFSAPMVRAILEGRKTQTRRIMNPQPIHAQHHEWRGKVTRDAEHRMWCWKDLVLDNIWDFPEGGDRKTVAAHCPYGVPGERLWVRETFRDPDTLEFFAYRADVGTHRWRECIDPDNCRWRPAIFMRRADSRITLEITDVRVQRLQEISEQDAQAEGVDRYVMGHGSVTNDDCAIEPGYAMYGRFRLGFEELWDSINAKRGFDWASNPWVWALTFKKRD